MLRLFTGAAGSGKTRRVMGEIRDAVRAGQGGVMLIVPEQYSHEAERELCRTCGGSLSLYAEALSFSALARAKRSPSAPKRTWLKRGERIDIPNSRRIFFRNAASSRFSVPAM